MAYTINYRRVKGTPLTNDEIDDNFLNLVTNKAELDSPSFTTLLNLAGKLTATAGAGAFTATGVGSGATSLQLVRPGAIADQKTWELISATDGTVQLRAVNDANSITNIVFSASRGAASAVSTLSFLPNGGRAIVGFGSDDGVNALQVNGGIAGTGSLNLTSTTANVELGAVSSVSTPVFDFHSSGNNTSYDPRFEATGGTATVGNGTLTFVAATSVFSGTKVLMNTATDSGSGAVLQVAGDIEATQGKVVATRYGQTGAIRLRSTGGTFGSPVATGSGNQISTIIGSGYDGATFRDSAAIDVWSEAGTTSTSAPGNLRFSTTPSGQIAVSERMRITASGSVLIGQTSDNGSDQLQVAGTIQSGTGFVFPDGTSLKSVGGLSGRNRVINGDCRIAQRAAASSVAGTALYGGPDRFQIVVGTTAGGTFSQSQVGANSTNGSGHFFVTQTVTAAATDFSAAKYWGGIYQGIEGFNCYDLKGFPISVSFVFLTNVTGTYASAIIDSTGTTSFITTFTAVAGVPKYISYTTPPLPLTAVVGDSVALGLILRIGQQNNGTLSTPTTNAWVAGNFLSTPGLTNWSNTLGNYISATDIQLEAGSVCTPFEREDVGVTQSKCQRYYEASALNGLFSGNVTSGGTYFSNAYFKRTKRAVPSCVVTGQSGNSSFPTTVSLAGSTTEGISASALANATNLGLYQYTWTASAEL